MTPAPLPDWSQCRVAVVGLGYVGLPIAIELDKTKKCVKTGISTIRTIYGFDIDHQRISELQNSYDRTGEILPSDLASNSISFPWKRFFDDRFFSIGHFNKMGKLFTVT